MTDDDLPDALKENEADAAAKAWRSIVNLVPLAGPALAELGPAVLPPQRIDRIAYTVHRIQVQQRGHAEILNAHGAGIAAGRTQINDVLDRLGPEREITPDQLEALRHIFKRTGCCNVIVIPERDDETRRYATKVAIALETVGLGVELQDAGYTMPPEIGLVLNPNYRAPAPLVELLIKALTVLDAAACIDDELDVFEFGPEKDVFTARIVVGTRR